MKPETTEQKFDERTRERALRDGTLTKQELQAFLKSLPDESSKTCEIPVFEEPAAEVTASDDTQSDEPTFSA